MAAQPQLLAQDMEPAPSKEEQASRQHEAQEKANQKTDEDSLTTILTLAQRTQLLVLLATATASMRNGLVSTFDAAATSSRAPSPSRNASEDDKIMNPNIDPGKVDVEAADRERKLTAAREKELSAPKMLELKTEVLAWFDHWREAMIGRVGEVLRKKKDAKQALDDQSSQQSGHNPGHGSRTSDRKINPEDTEANDERELNKKADEMLQQLYPSIETPLAELDEEKRILILHAMLLLSLSLEHYAAPSRILLLYLLNSLKLPVSVLDKDETKTAQGLLEATKELSGKSEAEQHAAANENSKKWKVGLATVAGAALVGVTGGLAAPLVAAGVGSVMGGLGLGATAAAGYLGSVAGSTIIVGGLFGAYGGKMTGKMMENYAKEVSDFAFLPVHERAKQTPHGKSEDETGKDSASARRLRVNIGITGWLTEEEEVVSPWQVLGHQTEVFALRWELESLMTLGNAMSAMVKSTAWKYAKKEIIARTIFADMMASLWPLGIVQLGRLVDNPFNITKIRAEKAGAVLADALINRAQGERPVTLIGYSLGSRLIHACLLTLAARKQFGLIDSVVLIGSPIPSDSKNWRAMRSVVSGRLVNVFSSNDYILGFLYRTSSIQLGVAGLQKIEGVHGVENIDVSETVSGHLRYQYLIGAILRKIGFEDLDLGAVQREEAAYKKMEEEEKRRAEELKSTASKVSGASYLKGSNDTKPGEDNENIDEEAVKTAASKEAAELEKDVHEKTQKSLMQRSMEYLSFGQSDTNSESRKPEQSSGAEKSYLEQAKQGGASVGSAASSLFQGARSRISWGAKTDTTDADKPDESKHDKSV